MLDDAMAALWNQPMQPYTIIMSPRSCWEMSRWVKWHDRMGAVVERSIPKWLPRGVRNLLRERAARKAWVPYRGWCDRWYAKSREHRAEPKASWPDLTSIYANILRVPPARYGGPELFQ
jgi:hypothetical protein